MSHLIENAQKELARKRAELGITAPVTIASLMPCAQEPPVATPPSCPAVPAHSASIPERVKLYPSLAAAFLRRHPRKPTRTLAGVGRLYHLAQAYDVMGSGRVGIDDLRDMFTSCTRMTRRHFADTLQDGEGITWTATRTHVYLFSPARVLLALDAGTLSGRPVYVPLAALCGGSQQLKAALYATFHSGRAAMPITRRSISDVTGVPRSTQIVYERAAGVHKAYNIGTNGEAATSENYQRAAWQHGRATFPLFDKRSGQSVMAWRLPNSYQAEYDTAPKGRQRKHNKRISLVIKRQRGNDSDIVRMYHPDGRIAMRAASREPKNPHYFPTGATLTFKASKPAKLAGVHIWRAV